MGIYPHYPAWPTTTLPFSYGGENGDGRWDKKRNTLEPMWAPLLGIHPMGHRTGNTPFYILLVPGYLRLVHFWHKRNRAPQMGMYSHIGPLYTNWSVCLPFGAQGPPSPLVLQLPGVGLAVTSHAASVPDKLQNREVNAVDS